MSDTAVLNVTPSTTGPQLIAGTAATGQFSFSILGDAGRFYRIFSSSNLASWTEENSFPAQFNFYSAPSVQPRNGIVYNDSGPVAVPQSAATKFYRVVNYTPPAPTNAICINHLAEIRFAKEAWALTTKQSEGATPAGEQIAPYFKNAIPACPLDVTQNSENSYVYRDLLHNPACRISLSHVLEQPEP